jgi:hypothetical protein
MVIILTEEQANEVRGQTSPISYLEPVALLENLYFLPIEVLSDENHNSKFDILSVCEQRELTEEETLFLTTN